MVIVIIFTNIVDCIYTKKSFIVPLLFEAKVFGGQLLEGTIFFKIGCFYRIFNDLDTPK